MIGTSISEWIFIRISIIIFRYMPFFYVAGLVVQYKRLGTFAWRSKSTKLLIVLVIAEAIFYVALWRPHQARLKEDTEHPKPLTRSERQALFEQCTTTIPSTEAYLRGWFMGAQLKDIRRENLREFILWAFFDVDGTKYSAEEAGVQEEIDDYIAKIESMLGHSLGEGRGSAQSLRLTFDSIETTYRGLVWYFIVFLVDQFTHCVMKSSGFEYFALPPGSASTFPPRLQEIDDTTLFSPAPDISYWYSPHTSGEDKVPVVFFHGIGIGLLSYIRFLIGIQATSADEERSNGVIAVEILPVSFRLTAPILERGEFVRQMTLILDHHGWGRFAAVSHSYGSVLTTHLLRSPQLQHRVVSTVLIDPVTIMLHLPQVAYNFTRRRPKGANEWQLWYFASTDPGVAHCLGRHFFWHQNIIWKEDLLFIKQGGVVKGRRRVAICLAGRDLIVDTGAVAQYLRTEDEHNTMNGASGQSLEAVLFPELDHAQLFDDPASLDRAVRLVTSYIAT